MEKRKKVSECIQQNCLVGRFQVSQIGRQVFARRWERQCRSEKMAATPVFRAMDRSTGSQGPRQVSSHLWAPVSSPAKEGK